MTEKVVYMKKEKKEQRHNNHENNDRRVDAIPALRFSSSVIKWNRPVGKRSRSVIKAIVVAMIIRGSNGRKQGRQGYLRRYRIRDAAQIANQLDYVI